MPPYFSRSTERKKKHHVSVELLGSRPQKSLSAVHSLLTSGINDAQERLTTVERSFYGPGLDATHELTAWAPLLRQAMSTAHLIGPFSSQSQMDELVRSEIDAVKPKFADDFMTLTRLQECMKKVVDAIPAKLAPCVHDLTSLLSLMSKYCLSFYDIEHCPPLETGETYQAQRRGYINIINQRLTDIEELADKFHDGSLKMSDFSVYGQELAERTDSGHAPFLLLFPEACENIRLALKEMIDWLGDDQSYSSFVINEIKDLEAKQTSTLKQVRAYRESYHQLMFRVKQAQTDYKNLSERLNKHESKEEHLIVDEELLSTQTQDLANEIDRADFRKNELLKSAGDRTEKSSDFYQTYNELSSNLREWKARQPALLQRLGTVRGKLHAIAERRNETSSLAVMLKRLEEDAREVAARLAEFEVEHDVCVRSLEMAQKIVNCKRSSDTVERIFYDRLLVLSGSVLPSSTTGKGSKRDEKHTAAAFHRACRITSQLIDSDWMPLYRSLPFYPSRGLSTIDADIERTMNGEESRDSSAAAAERALIRWRRYHTRANVEDLIGALERIGRRDVIARIENDITSSQRKPPAPAESEIPDWLEPELVPYWREIERYDRLNAVKVK